MRVAPAPLTKDEAPGSWPPLLATRGPGSHSRPHAHHAMHLVLAVAGELRVRAGAGWGAAAGVLTAPDVAHEIDGVGAEVLIVFVDPESDAGAALAPVLGDPVRRLDAVQRDALVAGVDPGALMATGGADWIARVVTALGGTPIPARPPAHPRVRRLLRQLRRLPPDADLSLPALAAGVGLSAGRLMHAFTSSVGLPLRPYIAWLRLQRASSAIARGSPLTQAAAEAGFADAAHMTRTFVRMLGVTPSTLRPR